MKPDWKGVVNKLQTILGNERVTDDPLDLLSYSRDASMDTGMPNVVVFPKTTQDVVDIVQVANTSKVPVIPRGSGSNVSGGVIATSRGGIIVSLTRMNKILELDEDNFQVLVEPGVICLDLNNYLMKYGLAFPPDPSSDKCATIGGMVRHVAVVVRRLIPLYKRNAIVKRHSKNIINILWRIQWGNWTLLPDGVPCADRKEQSCQHLKWHKSCNVHIRDVANQPVQ